MSTNIYKLPLQQPSFFMTNHPFLKDLQLPVHPTCLRCYSLTYRCWMLARNNITWYKRLKPWTCLNLLRCVLWPGFGSGGYRGGFREKLLEASPVSDGADAGRLQDGAKGWPTSDGGSAPGVRGKNPFAGGTGERSEHRWEPRPCSPPVRGRGRPGGSRRRSRGSPSLWGAPGRAGRAPSLWSPRSSSLHAAWGGPPGQGVPAGGPPWGQAGGEDPPHGGQKRQGQCVWDWAQPQPHSPVAPRGRREGNQEWGRAQEEGRGGGRVSLFLYYLLHYSDFDCQ